MRLFRVFLFAVAACDRQAPPPRVLPVANCAPPPSVISSAKGNNTPLRTGAVDSPQVALELKFVTPALGDVIVVSEPSAYWVQLELNGALADVTGIEVALDSERPRRLAPGGSGLSLKELLAADAELSQGSHWLFAAPILSSGLVPLRAPEGPRAAVARRFFVGHVPSGEAGPSGAVWLRKPEGTYNGVRNAARVLFDAYAFSGSGALLDAPCSISLRGPGVQGEIRLQSPFFALDVASGEYDASVSSAGAAASISRFTVNRELGGAP